MMPPPTSDALDLARDVDSDPTPPPAPRAASVKTLNDAVGVVQRLTGRMRRAVLGRDDTIELVAVAMLADGHVLLEDYPGSGKTTLAKALGDCIIDDQGREDIAALRRVQFTPDLLPSDVTGTTIFDPNTHQFFFRPGPIFAHVLLADEINRTSPKVQSALLEAMGEKQVTVDNQTRRLDDLFFVIATQNPLDLAGTFPLPSAQLDRFLFKIRMKHVARDAELAILSDLKAIRRGPGEDLPRVTRTEILEARALVEDQVYLAPEVREALVDFAEQTRKDTRVLQGASTRALVLGVAALRARALVHGRDHVTADDFDALVEPLFAHRLDLAPGVGKAEKVARDCAKPVLERLARASLRR